MSSLESSERWNFAQKLDLDPGPEENEELLLKFQSQWREFGDMEMKERMTDDGGTLYAALRPSARQ